MLFSELITVKTVVLNWHNISFSQYIFQKQKKIQNFYQGKCLGSPLAGYGPAMRLPSCYRSASDPSIYNTDLSFSTGFSGVATQPITIRWVLDVSG